MYVYNKLGQNWRRVGEDEHNEFHLKWTYNFVDESCTKNIFLEH